LDADGGTLLFLPYCLWNVFRGQFVRQMLENGLAVEEVSAPQDYPLSEEYIDNGLLLVARKFKSNGQSGTMKIEDLSLLPKYAQLSRVVNDSLSQLAFNKELASKL